MFRKKVILSGSGKFGGEMAFYIFRQWFWEFDDDGQQITCKKRGKQKEVGGQIMAAERKICFVETGE